MIKVFTEISPFIVFGSDSNKYYVILFSLLTASEKFGDHNFWPFFLGQAGLNLNS